MATRPISLKDFFGSGYLPGHLKKCVYRDLAEGRLTGYRCGKQWHVDPEEFLRFYREVGDMDFDCVLEAKAKDLALLKLREQLNWLPLAAY